MWGFEFPHPYLELYEASATAFKAVSPRLRVGGPSTMQTLNVGDFVSAANAAQIPYDFVSTHLYPTDPECVPGDASCFASLIASAREHVRTGAPWAEFLITEYNAGLFLKEEVDLDSASTAAFIFRQLASVEDVDMFSWWTFTDIFEYLASSSSSGSSSTSGSSSSDMEDTGHSSAADAQSTEALQDAIRNEGHGAQRGADDLPAAADQLSPPWARATQLVQWYRSSGRRVFNFYRHQRC